jgi:hypothetical protein
LIENAAFPTARNALPLLLLLLLLLPPPPPPRCMPAAYLPPLNVTTECA